MNAGSSLVLDADKTVDELVRSVKRVTDIMGDIASASNDAKHGYRAGQRRRQPDGWSPRPAPTAIAEIVRLRSQRLCEVR